MTDKISEFRRINEPRVQRALEQIRHIEKSAKSMRIHELDVQSLMAPIRDEYQRINEDTEEFLQEERRGQPMLERTPPIAREMEALAELSTQQLVDRMIACGAELARRRQ